MPASVTSSTRSPARSASTSPGCAPTRCPRSRTPPGRSTRDPEVGGQPPAAGGCPRRRRRRRRPAPRPAAAGASATRPIGVAASTSTPSRSSVPARSSTRPIIPHGVRAGRAAGPYSGAVTAVQQPPRRTEGLSTTADDRVVPSARRRLAPALRNDDRFSGWVATAGGHAARRVPAALAARAAAASSSSTRPTTPRTPGRCGTTATSPATSTARTRRSSTATSTGCGPSSPSMVVHPEAGKWLIGLGEAAVRDGPVRVADRHGGGRHADGAGDGPAGAPADRVDAAGLRGRTAAVLRRPAVRAVAAGAARRLPGVLPAVRGGLPGRRPRLGPRPAGPAGARRTSRWRPRLGPGPGAAVAPVAAGAPGSASAWPARPSGTRSSRSPRSGCWSWLWDAGARRALGVRGRGCARCVVDALPAFGYLVRRRARRLRR